MSRIAILAAAVADQIAAGEVVERPASIVKELVENALDAGARSVTVEAEEGGRAMLRIRDDGSGMTAEEAPLALHRHATSKIRTAQDLVGVGTFGFRGEALPAIASVARLVLETAVADGEGTRVVVANGERERIEPVARRRGTTITVTELFHAVPARRKFLRSARGEWRAIADLLAVTALVRRDVHLAAVHDGRTVFEAPPARTLRDRLAGVWGPDAAAAMTEVDDVRGAVHVRGLVEKPEHVGRAARRVFLMVNGRAIRDAGLVRAAEAAYVSAIPAGSRPSLALELIVPGDAVDVNVHPAKAEVRFHDRWAIERVVEEAVRRGLGVAAAAPLQGWRFGAERSWTPGRPAHGDVELLLPATPAPAPLFDALEADAPTGAGDDTEAHAGPSVGAPVDAPAVHVPAPVEVPPLVQLRRTWLMFERDDGIVLIDQHSAHERILYEQLMTRRTSGGTPVQVLLLPLTLHLSAAEADAFEEHREAFEQLGFGIEGFGGQTLVVQAVPMPHRRFDAEQALRETLASLAGDRLASTATRHERLAMTVACKSAIKAGDVLSPAEMRQLFLDLARTTLPAHDVHGRATIVQLGFDELERRFGRA
ncbi:MAG: DNA mismatch repair endonuclease MutL [Gemmatimonadaceae bacterium]|jgi:DNA mismatch repair protein MutL|nr:DNA mismatch repair endonuclease MutL [Gemmatimonadaceae bacterium]